MKLKQLIWLSLSASILSACASMSVSSTQTVPVTNKSSNKAQCQIVDSEDKQLASATIPRLNTVNLKVNESINGTALICKCADCKGKETYSAFSQLTYTKPNTLAGNPNKNVGPKVPYLLYS